MYGSIKIQRTTVRLRKLCCWLFLGFACFGQAVYALECRTTTSGAWSADTYGSAAAACKAIQMGAPIAQQAPGNYSCAGIPTTVSAGVVCTGDCQNPMDYDAARGECLNPDDQPDCDEMTGSPIVLSTGAKTLHEVDYRYAGVDPLGIEREYLYVPGNGNGSWRFKYRQSIKILYVHNSNLVRFIVDRGQKESYPFEASGLAGATIEASPSIKYSPYKLSVHFSSASLNYYPDIIPPASFILTLPDGSRETYNDNGRLTSITASNGLVNTITYPASDQIKIKDEAMGMFVIYTLSTENPIVVINAKVYQSDGTEASAYSYSYENGNLTNVLYQDGSSIIYGYGNYGNLVSKRDQNGDIHISWGYEANGSSALSKANHSHLGDTNAESKSIVYTPDANRFVTKARVTNATGLVTDYDFLVDTAKKASVLKHVGGQSTSTCAPPDSYMSYDSNRKRTTLTEGALDADDNGVPESEGIVTRYERNDPTRAHLVTAVTTGLEWASGALKPWQSGVVDPAQTQETTESQRVETDWHTIRELPVTRRYKGKTSTTPMTTYRTELFTYDESGSRCSNAPQATYRLCSKTIIDNTPFATAESGPRIWYYSYTMQGGSKPYVLSAMTVTDPRAKLTSYSYNSAGQLGSITYPAVNGVQQVVTYTNYNHYGLPRLVTDNGITTDVDYDARGRLKNTTTAGALTEITYWPNGLVKRVTQPDTSYLEYSYNSAHQLVRVVNQKAEHIDYTPSVLNGEWTDAITYKTSGTGDIASQQHRLFDALGRLWKQKNADGVDKVVYGHDQNDNLTNIIELGDASNTPTYDDSNRVVYRTYDGQNRLATETRCANAGTVPPLLCSDSPLVTTYTYDAQGNVATVKDANLHITSYTYNGFGELVQQTSPDTGITKYGYDESGNLVEKTKAYGPVDEQVITYSWDALNRLATINYPDTPQDVTYTWDEPGHGSGIGRLTTVADESGSTSYSYNAQGFVTSKQFITTGLLEPLTTRYDYVASGTKLDVITLPGGQQIKYPRTNGDISSITTNDPTAINGEYNLLTTFTRQPFGSVSGWRINTGTSGMAQSLSRSYDQNGNLLQRSVLDGNDSAVTSTYEYDSYSNISAMRRAGHPEQDEVYEYDALARLSKVTAQYGRITYGYDNVGNRTSRLMERQDPATQAWSEFYTEAYSISSTSNRLNSITRTRAANNLRSRSFGYDARGNITSDARSKTVGVTTTTDTLELDYGNSDRLNAVDVQ